MANEKVALMLPPKTNLLRISLEVRDASLCSFTDVGV